MLDALLQLSQKAKVALNKLDGFTLFLGGILLFSLTAGLGLRLIPLFHYTDFYYDMARDGYAVMGVLSGVWPTLGPSTSVANFSLPPHYFYFILPAILFGSDPKWQAMFNSLTSFLSVPLFGYILYKYYLNSLQPRIKWVLTVLGMIWVCFHFSFFMAATGSWNPNSLPFFTLLLVILGIWAYEKPHSYLHSAYIWLGLGFVSGSMIGLHSSALFAIPLFMLLFALVYLRRYGLKVWVFPVIALVMALLTLTPYFLGELDNHFANTKALTDYLLNSPAATLLERIGNIAELHYRSIAYFLVLDGFVPNWLQIAVALFLVLSYALMYKLHRKVTVILLGIWLTFLIIGSSFRGEVFSHYVLLGIWPPLFGVMACLAFLAKSHLRISAYIIFGPATLLLLFSFTTSLWSTYQRVSRDFNSSSRITVDDRKQILLTIPQGSTLCSYYHGSNILDFKYINQFILNNRVKFNSEECVADNYVIYLYDRLSERSLNPQLTTYISTPSFIIQKF